MLFRRLILLILLYLFIAVNSFAQVLRDEVVIVKSEPSPHILQSLDDMAGWLEDLREFEIKDHVLARKGGSHGSAFSFVTAGGERYFLTNYHVVSGAGNVSLEWQSLDDGNPFTIENCTVLYSDPFRDLALIALPEDADPPGKGLRIIQDSDVVKDGMEIWAAGYPGLISSPVWQLSNGIVSNQRAVIPELLREGRPYLIQHTSVVDPGSSGGPLMVREGDEYLVAGVNTLMANYRNNTFFSVSSGHMMDFIGESFDGEPAKESLESTLNGFVSLLSSESDDLQLSLYISDEFAGEMGWKLYIDRRRRMSFQDRDVWDSTIVLGRPLNGFKSFMAADLKKQVDQQPVSWEMNTLTDRETVIDLTTDNLSISTRWTYEQGRWKLTDYPLNLEEKDETEAAAEEAAKKDKRQAYNAGVGLTVGGAYSFGKFGADDPGFGSYHLGLEFLMIHNRSFGSSYVFSWDKYNLINKYEYDNTLKAFDPGVVGMNYYLNFFPTRLIKAHTIIPVIRAGAGVGVYLDGFFSDTNAEEATFIGHISGGCGLQVIPSGDKGVFSAIIEYRAVSSLFGFEDYTGGGSQVVMKLAYIFKR